jgi:hypothetical protein
MENKIKEEMATGDVSIPTMPLTPNGSHYGKPYFILSRQEFNHVIKKNVMPQRVKNYAATNGTTDFFARYNSVVFKVGKFFNLNK